LRCTVWTDEEQQAGIRRAKASRRFDIRMTVVLVVISLIVLPLVLRALVPATVPVPAQRSAFMLISMIGSLAFWTVLGRRTWYGIFRILLVLVILRLLTSNWKSFF
jgi:hypothetical protein